MNSGADVDQDPGERGGDLLLAGGDQEKRARDLDRAATSANIAHRDRSPRSAPAAAASGTSTSAASATRDQATIAGERSRIPILMNM